MKLPKLSLKNVLNRRIPTGFALVLLLVGLGATVFLVQKAVTTNTQATPEETPLNVTVTNITNNSFTVVFTTVANARTAVAMTDAAGNPQLFYDVRDSDNAKGGAFYGHSITVDKLEAQTTYKFTILSNAKVYKNNEHDYAITTFPKIDQEAPVQLPLKGTVNMPDATPAGDTVVVAIIDGASPVATLTNSKGEYSIPLDALRTKTGDAYYSVMNQTKVTLNYYRRTDTSRVVISYLKELTMLPNITLGQNYNFAGGKEEVQSEPEEASSFVLPTAAAVKIGQIQITIPKPNESFTDTQPEFRGTALPNSPILVIIKNAQIKEKISADARGAWSFRPTQVLPAGAQTLTIQTPDKQGFTRQLSVPFTVFASGSQVADTATPSATLAPSASPTITETPLPTISAQITTVPTQEPTLIPTEVLVASPTPATQLPPKALPPTGDISIPIIVSAFSMLFIVAGSFILFLL